MTRSSGKHGVPVMAYPTANASSPMLLSLNVKRNKDKRLATISLQTSLSLQGFGVAQLFVLQYDADNVEPGTLSLRPVAIPLGAGTG